MERTRIFEKSVSLDIEVDGMTLEEVAMHYKKIYDLYEQDIMQYDKRVVVRADNYGYDGGCDWYIDIYRWETEKEIAKREEELKKNKRRIKELKK